jgi:hypothetical protein
MIPLGEGFYAYVDAADYEGLTRHVWYLSNGYAVRNENGKRIYMHRQLAEAPADMVVDHMDGNRANNCRFNLRVCTRSENLRNQRKRLGSRSRFKGVLYDKQYRKWFAVCGRHFRGYFNDEIEAARAYDRMAVQYLDEFARLNFSHLPVIRSARICRTAASRRPPGIEFLLLWAPRAWGSEWAGMAAHGARRA